MTDTLSSPSAPCNTGRANYALHAGVDTMHLTYMGQTKVDSSSNISALRDVAKSKNDLQRCIINLAGHDLAVLPHGSGRFPFALQSAFFYVAVSRPGSSLPCVQVQVKSEAFLEWGAERACQYADAVASALADVEASHVSRYDVCMDILKPADFNKIARRNLVCRAKNLVQHHRGMKQTGVSLGYGSDVAIRLYDKTEEVLAKNKLHWHDVWHGNGWDQNTPVLRVEYQIKRRELKSMGLLHWSELLASTGRIWAHYCTKWFRVALEEQDTLNQTRWKVAEWWQQVASSYSGNNQPLKREKKIERDPTDRYKYRNGLAAIWSHMATTDKADLNQALRDFFDKAMQYHGGYDAFLFYARDRVKHHQYLQAKRSKAKGFFIPSPQYINGVFPRNVQEDSLEAIPF